VAEFELTLFAVDIKKEGAQETVGFISRLGGLAISAQVIN